MSFSIRSFQLAVAVFSATMFQTAALEPPVNLRCVDTRSDGFTAVWDGVDGADAYMVRRYETTEADDDTLLNILSEDFSGAMDGEMDNVVYAGDIDMITAAAGWEATAFAQSTGNFVFVPMAEGVELTTCGIDVPASGHIDVSVTLAEYYNERFYTGGEVVISVLDVDGSVTDTKTIDITHAGFATYDMRFEIGQSMRSCRLRIGFDNGGNRHKLFLDDIYAWQRVVTGDEITVIADELVTEACNASFNVESRPGVGHSFAVASMRHGAGSPAPAVASVFSAPCHVELCDAHVVEVADDAGAGAIVSGFHEITLRGNKARVFTPDGRCIYDGGPGIIKVAPRCVVVTIDGKTMKFSL